MTYKGFEAIKYLEERYLNDDVSASSHWKKFHKKFRFDGKNFLGLEGFGGNKKPYNIYKKIIHKIFQFRYLKMNSSNQFKKILGNAKKIAAKQNRALDLDFIRQCLTIDFIRSKIELKEKNILIIGDGFASLTSLFLEENISKIFLINLTKTLLVDLVYIRKHIGEILFNKKVCLIDSKAKNFKDIFDKFEIICVEAKNSNLIEYFPIDIAINVASMQEMDIKSINDYFKRLYFISKNRDIYFYCCNRESKKLPDGEVINFKNYPWGEDDLIVVDELCPWHQDYYSKRPPFYHKYEGKHRHQLRKLVYYE